MQLLAPAITAVDAGIEDVGREDVDAAVNLADVMRAAQAALMSATYSRSSAAVAPPPEYVLYREGAQYVAEMKAHVLQCVDMHDGSGCCRIRMLHKFAGIEAVADFTACNRAVQKELRKLATTLPLDFGSSVFLRYAHGGGKFGRGCFVSCVAPAQV